MSIEALSSLSSLEKWIALKGYAGYDPYDIKSNPLVIKLTAIGNRNTAASILREIVFEFFYTFPVLSRDILKVRPAINAKAMGLFATSYLELYSLLKEAYYNEKSEYCYKWLKDNKILTNEGIGWGYPFDWQSKQLIPAGTPNGIVTAAAGEAFWKHYQFFGDQESLDYCINICEFLNSLPFDQINEHQICFSYTPLFINHVHNLNLFVAEFLIKTGMETGNTGWVKLGNKAINYTIANQLRNGAFDYNGPPEKPNNHIDNYHTGFVLRMLYSLWKLTNREDVFSALNLCYQHYTAHFFADNRIPKLTPDRKYRIDIHSCAESINCLTELSSIFPQGLILADNVLNWTIDNLQDKSGYFYYGVLKSRFTGIPFKSKIPYIRWGQAWMLKAMSSYLIATHKKNI